MPIDPMQRRTTPPLSGLGVFISSGLSLLLVLHSGLAIAQPDPNPTIPQPPASLVEVGGGGVPPKIGSPPGPVAVKADPRKICVGRSSAEPGTTPLETDALLIDAVCSALADADTALKGAENQSKELEARVGSTSKELAEARASILALSATIGNKEEEIEDLRTQLTSTSAELATTTTQYEGVLKQRQNLQDQTGELRSDVDKRSKEIDDLRQKILRGKVELRETLENKTAKLEEVQGNLAAKVNELQKKSEEARGLEAKLAATSELSAQQASDLTAKQQRLIEAQRQLASFQRVAMYLLPAFLGLVLIVGIVTRAGAKRHEVRLYRRVIHDMTSDRRPLSTLKRAVLRDFARNRALVRSARVLLDVALGAAAVAGGGAAILLVSGLSDTLNPLETVKLVVDGSLWQLIVGILGPVGAIWTMYHSVQAKLAETIDQCQKLELLPASDIKAEIDEDDDL